ncbi:hypothetical protein MIR68_008685 [Amoeboaphelidium protococcarum]|nr:hypothetical protein MIR68_008685 [Amoeboaphelidium protococcarum]
MTEVNKISSKDDLLKVLIENKDLTYSQSIDACHRYVELSVDKLHEVDDAEIVRLCNLYQVHNSDKSVTLCLALLLSQLLPKAQVGIVNSMVVPMLVKECSRSLSSRSMSVLQLTIQILDSCLICPQVVDKHQVLTVYIEMHKLFSVLSEDVGINLKVALVPTLNCTLYGLASKVAQSVVEIKYKLLFELLLMFTVKAECLFNNLTNVTEDVHALAEQEMMAALYSCWALLKDDPDLDNFHSYDVSVLFRRSWGWAVLLALQEDNTFKTHWIDVMSKLAQVTSQFIPPSVESTYQFGLQQQDQDIVKKALLDMCQKMIPNYHYLKNKSLANLVHVLSVYHLELFRFGLKKQKVLKVNMFDYVRNVKHFQFSVNLMQDVILAVFMNGIDNVHYSYDNQEFAKSIVNSALVEITQETLKDFVLTVIKNVYEACPIIILDVQIAQSLLNVLDLLKKALDDEMYGRTSFEYYAKINGKLIKFNIKHGYKYRYRMLQNFGELVTLTLSDIIDRNSHGFMSVLEQLAENVEKDKSKQSSYGFDYILQIVQTKFPNEANIISVIRDSYLNAMNVGKIVGEKGGDESAMGELLQSSKQELTEYQTKHFKTSYLEDYSNSLHRAYAIFAKTHDQELLRVLCLLPFQIFKKDAVTLSIEMVSNLHCNYPQFQIEILNHFFDGWQLLARQKKGIYTATHVMGYTIMSKKMSYGPSSVNKDVENSFAYFVPMLTIIQFLSGIMQTYGRHSLDYRRICTRIMAEVLSERLNLSNHTMSRFCGLHLFKMFWDVQCYQSGGSVWYNKSQLLDFLFLILSNTTSWHGHFQEYVKDEIDLLKHIYHDMKAKLDSDYDSSDGYFRSLVMSMKDLAVVAVEEALIKDAVWLDPLVGSKQLGIPVKGLHGVDTPHLVNYVQRLWNVCPRLVLTIALRNPSQTLVNTVTELTVKSSFLLHNMPEAFPFLLRAADKDKEKAFKYLYFWQPVAPITAICLQVPELNKMSPLFEYKLRSLDSYTAESVFFYVPQIVQSLRYDQLGYAERFVLKTAKSNQLFAHQVIWNINANLYKRYVDDDNCQADEIKPALERVRDCIINQLSGNDMTFFEREFNFFEKVTGISGSLKPFIKKSKTEKKQKIDEELRQVVVDPGVYLPSNPDCILVDIDYNSGKPLQSHAKAPFMATFKIRKTDRVVPPTSALSRKQSSYETIYMSEVQLDSLNESEEGDDQQEEQWQSAIFKVGDDCRQDLLALQLIAIFKNIFSGVGLDLYVFPYRIVATAPGCGIIEVVPNSVSRDQMGRQSTNNLYKWFLAKYGSPNSLNFQRARNAFIRSLAAYSVVVYLLQIKDRHNGNVLIDEFGHVIHIDFGFIFDIVPGGIKFELSPFKLTKEMVDIMGGRDSDDYQKFVELCVRAFLVARPYAEQIIDMVQMMLGSGLPCFKPAQTIYGLRSRFQLNLSDEDAAKYMKNIVNQSYLAWSSYVYDYYQRLTNGIPF